MVAASFGDEEPDHSTEYCPVAFGERFDAAVTPAKGFCEAGTISTFGFTLKSGGGAVTASRASWDRSTWRIGRTCAAMMVATIRVTAEIAIGTTPRKRTGLIRAQNPTRRVNRP
jgi:hypothetical protein